MFVCSSTEAQAQVFGVLEKCLKKPVLSSTGRKYDKSSFINQWEPAVSYSKLKLMWNAG